MAEFAAEKKFWATPELIEKLLPFLDLPSVKELAQANQLTRKILSGVFVWKKFIEKIFPEGGNNNVDHGHMPTEDDPHLVSVRPKAKLLSQILKTMEDSLIMGLREQDLLHLICERYPQVESRLFPLYRSHHVSVSCFCNQVHQVSAWGLVLLEDVEVAFGSREQSVVEVVTGFSCTAEGPLLAALSSRLPRQQEKLMNLTLGAIRCDGNKDALTLASLIDHIPGDGPGTWNFGVNWGQRIFVMDEIGAEGWVALRRAVERLQGGRPRISLHCDRELMATGRVDDLRAIWNAIGEWNVYSGPDDDGPLCFAKWYLDEELGWEGGFEDVGGVDRKGLNAVVDMSEEEWQEELRNVHRLESCSEDDQQVDDEDSGPE